MKPNHFNLIFIIFFAFQSCSNSTADQSDANSKSADNGKKYIMTIYQDKFDSSTSKFKPNNVTDTLKATSDTTAYFAALKKFYNQKIIERKNFNYGQPKSFLITDKDGIDLKAKLSDKLTIGLKDQVENMPDVKNMIEEYRKDSL